METNVVLSSIPFSESDRLLQSWGYDLIGEYGAVANMIPATQEPVIELATGTGRMCAVLSFSCPRIVTGDISLKDLPKTLHRLPPQHAHRISVLQLNMERLPFRTGSIRTIVCMNTMHEVAAPQTCLHEMIRVLHPDGLLAVGDFNATGFAMMQKVHHRVYHNEHSTGSIAMSDVESTLRSGFRDVRHLSTPLNETVFASGKRSSALLPKPFSALRQ